MTAIVLAGGKSLRLGQDKTSLVIDGRRLLQRVIDLVASLADEVIVVTSDQHKGLALFSDLSAKVVVDIYPGKGSLGGIYTGLRASNFSHSLVVACDMPFLNPALLRYLVSLAPEFDVVIPRVRDLLEPLHAVYSKNCLAPAEELLQRGQLKVLDIFDQVKVRYVEEEEINRFDPEHLSFFNINTQKDLDKAMGMVTHRKLACDRYR